MGGAGPHPRTPREGEVARGPGSGAYRAADAWISRVHGRPKETVENVNVPDPLDVAKMSREQRQALKREILRQHPELADEYRRMAGIE